MALAIGQTKNRDRPDWKISLLGNISHNHVGYSPAFFAGGCGTVCKCLGADPYIPEYTPDIKNIPRYGYG
ncbi:hypothetical protein [Komagataeibacter europaeus]|uniref:hypothetical protein n=1 Tax=Komagataeibacter europaeus TaxID=33995 RepID=UPI0012DEF761|nr:hypothetical protein [Komagataeibacter europaeus]